MAEVHGGAGSPNTRAHQWLDAQKFAAIGVGRTRAPRAGGKRTIHTENFSRAVLKMGDGDRPEAKTPTTNAEVRGFLALARNIGTCMRSAACIVSWSARVLASVFS